MNPGSEHLKVALQAARAGGRILLEHFGKIDREDADLKATNDYVTFVDRASERAILDHLRAAFPDHTILAEESGRHGEGTFEWAVDPLDGTKNYIHGLPWFAVSIALLGEGRPRVGLVYDPLRDVVFTAERGGGAFRNGRPIRVSSARDLEGTLLATGFPFRAKSHADRYFETLKEVFRRASGVRRAGSAALDLAHVAMGTFDGFFELGLSAWDIAAGALLIEEAGGVITDVRGGDRYLESGNVVAGSPGVHTSLLRMIQDRLGDQDLQ
jgi:myo-inositol-1(or 4)-monophosphatase